MHPTVLLAAERGRGGVRRAKESGGPAQPAAPGAGPGWAAKVAALGSGDRSSPQGTVGRAGLSRGLADLVLLLRSPPLAARLLAHKIQSPQEVEALHALTVSALGHVRREAATIAGLGQ